jgi:paraquat-inducible protein A
LNRPTLANQGLRQCRSCHLLLTAGNGFPARCPRCAAHLTPGSDQCLHTTTALLIAALALYIPSNMLPIMLTRSALGERSDTILSGILVLSHGNSWPLAIIVFVASVLVPLLKLGVLSYLVLSVRLGWRHGRARRTRLYRLIELVGRWSMLDVFVVGVLAALVHLGPAAEVAAGPGIVAFGAVVWLTIWATQSFDPKLIWKDADD